MYLYFQDGAELTLHPQIQDMHVVQNFLNHLYMNEFSFYFRGCKTTDLVVPCYDSNIRGLIEHDPENI
jgi:hypothetical protein